MAYFLKEDSEGAPTIYGAEGVEEFRQGRVRKHDFDILRRLDFAGKTVLDLGFGRGEMIKFAVENGARKVVGVDFSEDANAIAQALLDRYGVHADLYCDDALAFFQSYTQRENAGAFDIVLMLDFVEHIPRFELTEILKLMHRVLSARSVLAINTPLFQVDNDVIANGLDPRARDTSDDFEETAGMHCNRYTKKSLRNFMKSCGFVAISGRFFVPNLSIARPLEGSRWAWLKASKMGYPVLLPAIWRPERFECAFCWEETQKRRNRRTHRIFRFGKRALEILIPQTGFRRTDERRELTPEWAKVMAGPLQGHHLLLDLKSPVFWHRKMMEGQYDSFIYDALDKYGSIEEAAVWDVGAHVGYHSLALAALVGAAGHVVAFEPNPYNVNRFRTNLQRNSELAKRVTVMTCALSNVDGKTSFLFSPDVDSGRSSGSHLDDATVPGSPDEYQGFARTTVTTAKVDSLLLKKGLRPPSIMKIDVEGAERFVLEGARELLASRKPLLFIEIHNVTMMFHVQKLLTNLGYVMEILDEDHTSLSRCFVMAKANRGR